MRIVLINSTVGLTARANVSQFAATQHALKAIADSLREEINPHGPTGIERLSRPNGDAPAGRDPCDGGKGCTLPSG
jgi:hypothetical protein